MVVFVAVEVEPIGELILGSWGGIGVAGGLIGDRIEDLEDGVAAWEGGEGIVDEESGGGEEEEGAGGGGEDGRGAEVWSERGGGVGVELSDEGIWGEDGEDGGGDLGIESELGLEGIGEIGVRLGEVEGFEGGAIWWGGGAMGLEEEGGFFGGHEWREEASWRRVEPMRAGRECGGRRRSSAISELEKRWR